MACMFARAQTLNISCRKVGGEQLALFRKLLTKLAKTLKFQAHRPYPQELLTSLIRSSSNQRGDIDVHDQGVRLQLRGGTEVPLRELLGQSENRAG